MKQPIHIFSAPFFIEKIDLDKIKMADDADYHKSYLSHIPTTMGTDSFTEESYHYVHGVIEDCIGQFLPDRPFYIGQVWRNKYTKTDWQDPHIHSGAQWSFIIYESVEHSRTVFMNPARKVIMNQWGMYVDSIMTDFFPQIEPGHICIFPAWVEHFVTSGGEGVSIAGNCYLQQPPEGP